MVADDTLYNTPHETALAVVATAMKKARLQIPTLMINTIVGGILFSSGSIMTMAASAENPGLWQNNPGILSAYSGLVYGISLFYVVIMGADLFNSNILFFSVGLLRQAVTVYDLLISWTISLIGNLGGGLFVAYLFVHLSGIGTSELWVAASRELVEHKASFPFVRTMLKAIAGNFYVCLAIYLQLMAKPLHVRLFVIVLPIFTFVSCGFTHAVADMSYCYIGMLNGADVSVGEYIWKLLIPACVGNIIGGFAFSLVIPFYLHLIVVEQDRKRLSLPEYDARDEQPELNTDSRVVRVSPRQEREEELEAAKTDDYDGEPSEKAELDDSNSTNSHLSRGANSTARPPTLSSVGEQSPYALDHSQPQLYETNTEDYVPNLSRINTLRSVSSRRSTHSSARRVVRSPPGVFPVRGMGEPLMRERTIENPKHALNELPYGGGEDSPRTYPASSPVSRTLSRRGTNTPDTLERRYVHTDQPGDGEYTVLEERPGAKLEKVITKLMEHKNKSRTLGSLPRTTQDTFPHNRPGLNPTYSQGDTGNTNRRPSSWLGSLSKEFTHTEPPLDYEDLQRRLHDAGISNRAALAANTVAGVSYDNLDLSTSQTADFKKSHAQSNTREVEDLHSLKRSKTASAGTVLRKKADSKLDAIDKGPKLDEGSDGSID